MPRLTADELSATVAAIFRATGAGEEDAALVAQSLVESELCGHPSHGLIRVPEYVGQIRDGAIDPAARPEIVSDRGATLVVDGHWGFGQVVATEATQRLIERTREHGSAAVAVRRCAHVGRAGVYPERAAAHGLVAFAFVNGGGAKPRVAPHAGRRAVFGTNPIAAAVPLPGSDPVVIDFSTAAVASGKIRVLRQRGEPLPEGWIIDAEGHSSTSAEDYYAGGMLLPAAAHKGYALCLLVELLAGCLTGAGSPGVPGSDYRVGNGVFLQAFDVEAFAAVERFGQAASALAVTLHDTPPAEGHKRVLLPGEPERDLAARRVEEGIDVSASTWENIASEAAALGVAVQGG
jgi:LDH2 family malate/lactate/ureidoglycolate dehydrogenase